MNEIAVPRRNFPADGGTARREFRGWVFAKDSRDRGGAAGSGFPNFEGNPAKFCRLFRLPFEKVVVADKPADGRASAFPLENKEKTAEAVHRRESGGA